MTDNNIINESVSGSNIESYKIVILGDQFAGKTSILNKFKYENSDDRYTPTIGIDFVTKNIYLEDKTIRLIMWDTAGSERFKSLIPSYIKNANAIIITYDITSRNSFMSLDKWLNDIVDKVPKDAYIIIAGNKLDLEHQRQVTIEDVKKFANDKKLEFIETSAKTGENINHLFETITSVLYGSEGIKRENKDITVILDNEYKNINNEAYNNKSGCKGKSCGGKKKR